MVMTRRIGQMIRSAVKTIIKSKNLLKNTCTYGLFQVVNNRVIGMLCSIVIQEELITVLSHLLDIRCKNLVHSLHKFLNRITGTIESIPVFLCYQTCITVRISCSKDRFLSYQVREQTTWIVRNRETVIKEYQTYITSSRKCIVIRLG